MCHTESHIQMYLEKFFGTAMLLLLSQEIVAVVGL